MKTKILSSQVDVAGAGPFLTIVIGEVELQNESEHYFVSLTEVDGHPNFFRTEESTFERQMKLNRDENKDGAIDETAMLRILREGAFGPQDYEKVYEAEEEKSREMRFLTYLVRSGWEDAKSFMADTQGRILEELEIPYPFDEDDFDECSVTEG